MMASIGETFSALPRSAKWLIYAAVVLIGYFLVFEPVTDRTIAMNDEADRLRIRIDSYRAQMDRQMDAEADLALGVMRFGMVNLPASEEVAVQRLYDRIDEIVGDQRNLRITQRRAIPLPKDVMQGQVSGGESLSRFVVDLELEGSPALISEVLVDLETSPDVTSVGRVSLRKVTTDGKKLVRATISPEVWVIGGSS